MNINAQVFFNFINLTKNLNSSKIFFVALCIFDIYPSRWPIATRWITRKFLPSSNACAALCNVQAKTHLLQNCWSCTLTLRAKTSHTWCNTYVKTHRERKKTHRNISNMINSKLVFASGRQTYQYFILEWLTKMSIECLQFHQGLKSVFPHTSLLHKLMM